MASSATAPPLDFAALLAREYRPARVSQLSWKDRPLPKRSHTVVEGAVDMVDGENDEDAARQTDHLKGSTHSATHPAHQPQFYNHERGGAEESSSSSKKSKADIEEETARLVLQLVSKTPAYTKHLQQAEATKVVDDAELQGYIKGNPRHQQKHDEPKKFKASFHQVELDDWESKIQWKGYEETKEDTTKNLQAESPNAIDATSLLQKRRNPFLENLDFSQAISWSGAKADLAEKARNLPLILELGVAGQSIARYVLPSHRPVPCVKSDEYQQRMEKEWNAGEITSTADISKGSLHADKDKMERLIKHRQEKRRQMAKDKTNRVTEAMGTLNVLGSGRGRTITSSLMGPGGTERTGRPSRHVGANASHDTEYVEQLDMITNHMLVKDLDKVSLRQYHRPKIPLTFVRTTLIWQFAIRYLPANKKGNGQPTTGGTGDNSSSYQAMMMGSHAGAVSKSKLRTEADLSPAEGQLILIEYSEERQPLQLTKGMASKIVTYYRGDKVSDDWLYPSYSAPVSSHVCSLLLLHS